jgi:hypothetical protein
LLDAVLVNDNLQTESFAKYEEQGQYPVNLDIDKIKELGIDIYAKNLIEPNKEGLIRHSSNKVARAIYCWFRKGNK